MARLPLKINFTLDTDAGAHARDFRLRIPHRLQIPVDSDAGVSAFLAQKTRGHLSIPIDNTAIASLSTLRRTMIGRPPEISLSIWHNGGLKPLDGAILRRGDIAHIQADVIAPKLEHFVLSSFVLKPNLGVANERAPIWLTNQPDRAGIELVATRETVANYGAAQQRVYQIGIDSIYTRRFSSRVMLHYEFQLDDTMGEVYSSAGTITIIPDVYR